MTGDLCVDYKYYFSIGQKTIKIQNIYYTYTIFIDVINITLTRQQKYTTYELHVKPKLYNQLEQKTSNNIYICNKLERNTLLHFNGF